MARKRLIDINDPQSVEILITDDMPEGKVRVWINIDEVCVMRVISPKQLSVEDKREKK